MFSPIKLTLFTARAGANRCSTLRHTRRLITPAIALGGCALLLILFQHVSHAVHYRSVIHQLRQLSAAEWTGALAATVVSYIGLVGRDMVGLHHIGARVPRALLLLGATVGSAIGNATGFGALTGGAVRCRIYGAAGVTPARVGRLTVFTGIGLAAALVLISAAGMLFVAGQLESALHLPASMLRCAGTLALAAIVALVVTCRSRPYTIGGSGARRWLALTIPSRRDLIAQLGWSIVDVAGAALALWTLLPDTSIGFATFITVYAAALLLGMVGHTPGGIGVFEGVVLIAFERDLPMPQLVAALLAYRALYFGLPLLVCGGTLVIFEGRALKRVVMTSPALHAARGLAQLAPLLLSTITFAVGCMLIVSGATPAFMHRIAVLSTLVPLWVLESSQLLASVLGVLLLFVARGLLRRLDAAWWLALLLASVNLGLSLAKGLAFIEAGVLGILVLLLIATRHHFNRRSSLFGERFTPGWLVSVGIVIVIATWILLYAFRDVPYTHELWWQFAFDGRAPRALRATLAAALCAAALAFWQLLRPAAGRFIKPAEQDLADAARIVRAQERSDAGLAMMGDKSFLFSASRQAFLMYAKRGRTWVALHDPVGPRDEWSELIRRFVALAHTHGGRAAFYQVRADALPFYLDTGLHLLKLGEEANIALADFDLKGSHRAHLRYALKRGERDGLAIEMIEPARMPESMPMLKSISDAWLQSRVAREKSFSVAAFNPAYLAAQSVMLLRQHGRPVAFVTFMTTDVHTEATVGVMRHLPDASGYAMDYLFTKLALHLKDAGLRTLSLGIAPLSGVQPTPFPSLWQRVARLAWHLGGRFYNFRGLRGFKSKFQPHWEPRYLAVSGSLGLFVTLADISLLAGGWRS
ncbi:bifunctional lysylphosphatidylglycerol flippase/synthetase MprF [Mycetohabitans rhizoxinica]|uniref:bifunctional lysylphosphatidylglycerol flippase/synthetase MprF n=1 Tax=Mycetohabitans rhizoxinica TaxID=412963 RepID=UPI0030D4DE1D